MNETTDAAEILAPLWKRKWLILAVGLLVAGVTYAYYNHQPKVYRATTAVYLGNDAEIQSLVGGGAISEQASKRELADQAQLINSSVVGKVVQHQLLRKHEITAASGTATAIPAEESSFIAISAEAATGQAAATLANTYAQAYLAQRVAAYKRQVQYALQVTRKQLRDAEETRSSNTEASIQTLGLLERINLLKSDLSVANRRVRQIDPAVASAVPLSPKPKRNAVFGFVLGIVFAGMAAYVLSRFDRRLRTLGDVEEIFNAPVLAAVPSIRRPILHADGQPVPAETLREPLRRLHTNLQLRGLSEELDRRSSPRVVLFISPESGDGKSTLIAGLALVQREAGARVAVVESDFRRPIQAELLDVDGSRGLAEVLAGNLTTELAMQPVNFTPAEGGANFSNAAETATAVKPRHTGSISVLTSGGTVPNPPALISGLRMPTLLKSLAATFDYVLVDAPPPLAVSDVLPLLGMVDAIVIVARAGHTRETSAQRLAELLSHSGHAPVIGTVGNDLPTAEIDAYGLSSTYYYQRPRGS